MDETGPQRAQIALLRRQLWDEVTLDYRVQEVLLDRPVWSFQLSCKLRPSETRRSRGRTRS